MEIRRLNTQISNVTVPTQNEVRSTSIRSNRGSLISARSFVFKSKQQNEFMFGKSKVIRENEHQKNCRLSHEIYSVSTPQKVKFKKQSVASKLRNNYSVVPKVSLQKKLEFFFSPYNPKLAFKRYMRFDEDNEEEVQENDDQKQKNSDWKFLANFLLNEDLPTFRMACKQINGQFYKQLSTFSKSLKDGDLMSLRTKTQLPPVYEKIRVHQAPSVLNDVKERAIFKFRRLVRNIIRERKFIKAITQHLDIKEREENEIYKKNSLNLTPMSAKQLIKKMNEVKERQSLRKPQAKKSTIETLIDNHIRQSIRRPSRFVEPPIVIENDDFFKDNNFKSFSRVPSRFKPTVPVNPITQKFLNEKMLINKKMEEVEKRFEETLTKTPNMKRFFGKTVRISDSTPKIIEVINSQAKITKFKSILGDKKIITPNKLDLSNYNIKNINVSPKFQPKTSGVELHKKTQLVTNPKLYQTERSCKRVKDTDLRGHTINEEEKDDSIIEYEEYQDAAFPKSQKLKNELVTLEFYTGGNEVESRNDFSYTHSMDENPNKSSGHDENQRSTTEEDITMFSRPIYYFSQGEHKVNELRDNLKPEIEHLHFQTCGHEDRNDFQSNNFKATTADSKEKETEESKKISDSNQNRQQIFELANKNDGFSFKDIQKPEESSKTATFGFKPVRRKSSKVETAANINSEFMDTVSRAINFFSKKLEINSPPK